jgi:hypothetical protein
VSASTIDDDPAQAFSPDRLALLRDAAEWRLIGLLLTAPRGAWRDEVGALVDDVRDDQLREAARLAQLDADEAIYDSTFGPGGPVPPREISYRPAAISSQHLAELAGCYEAFGYEAPYNEPVDHVAIVADFVAYLKLKEAFAVACGDGDHASSSSEAAAHVVAEHLACIAAPLADRLETSGIRHLALAADALSRRTGLPNRGQVADLPILNDEPGDESMWACADGEANCDEAPEIW